MRFFNENSYQSDDEESNSSEIMIVDDLNLDIEEPKIKKKRIREKLDHLSNEEKLMRRKMKNRISAQSARDRKKTKMQTLERKIEILCEDRQKILKENVILKKQNEQIIKENSDLKQRLNDIENKLNLMNSSTPIKSSSLPIQINQTSSTHRIRSFISAEDGSFRDNLRFKDIEFKDQQEISKCKKQGTVDFNQAIDKLIHDNDEYEDIDFLLDCYQDLLTANIEETTPKIEQRSNENIVRECGEETIDDGSFENRTEIKDEINCWEATTAEENKLSEINLNDNSSLNSSINSNQSIHSNYQTSSSNLKEEQINSIKDLIIFNDDHQYAKNTNFTNSNTFTPSTTTTNYFVEEEQQQLQISSDLLSSNLPPLTIEEVLNDNNRINDDLIYDTNLNSQHSFYSNSLESPSIESDSNSFLNDDCLYSFNQHPTCVSFDF